MAHALHPSTQTADRPTPVGVLPDGTSLRVRPLQPGDRDTVLQRFHALSPASRRARFLQPRDELTERDLRLLADDVDGEWHVAVVLEAVRTVRDARGVGTHTEVSGVGVARYVRSSHQPSVADVAFTIDDGWHGRGCGRRLVGALAEHARRAGVRVFSADVLDDNAASLRLLAGLGALSRVGNVDEILQVEVVLEDAEPTALAA